MKIAADLHIHSTLSPCASLEMSPAAIVRRARELAPGRRSPSPTTTASKTVSSRPTLGEKTACRFFSAWKPRPAKTSTSCACFEDRRQAERFNERIYALLPDVNNNPDFFGDQVVVDEQDNIVRHEEKLLLNALDASVPELLELVSAHQRHSPFPPMSRAPPFGLLVNLGWSRPNSTARFWKYPARRRPEAVLKTYPDLARYPLISNSDAHFLKDIGRAHTIFDAADASLPALIAAARQRRLSQVVYRGRPWLKISASTWSTWCKIPWPPAPATSA